MNKRHKLGIAVFFAVALFFVILFWLCGYDFDHRGSSVGMGFFLASFVSIFAGTFAAFGPNE